MKAVEEIFGAGDAKSVGVALEAGRTFGEKKRLKMSGVDKKDKAGARDKRMEKKRKRKLAARPVRDGVDGPTLAGVDAEGGGYVFPEFDLLSASESESEQDDAPPQKPQKPSRKTREDSDLRESRPMALVDEEAPSALGLLRRLSWPVQRSMRPYLRAPYVSPPCSPFDAPSFVPLIIDKIIHFTLTSTTVNCCLRVSRCNFHPLAYYMRMLTQPTQLTTV
ncbi:hypothetical protein BGY98DRAFT_1093735 [Russula aff. rugulosa BPL654]|nr:hypothetical protein BGY98DRAFT_1093735 [Russula aff. rugulosa BPL654]